MAHSVHRHNKMVKLAGNKDGVARNTLHRTLYSTLMTVGESARKGRVVESPTTVPLFVSENASSANVAGCVCHSIEAHKHLPCHITVESVGK